MRTAINTAAAKLGYAQLKDKQYDAIEGFISGRDVFVCLPTGCGKSLCYALLPLIFDTLRSKSNSQALIVSPLIALMKDQESSFGKKGVRAVHVTKEDEETMLAVMAGNYQLIYISPETLLTDRQWRHVIESPLFQKNLVAFVVDEAHCIKKLISG